MYLFRNNRAIVAGNISSDTSDTIEQNWEDEPNSATLQRVDTRPVAELKINSSTSGYKEGFPDVDESLSKDANFTESGKIQVSAKFSDVNVSKKLSLREISKRGSLIQSLIEVQEKEEEEKKRCCVISNNFRVTLVFILLPCILSLWYSAAILFPPDAREKYNHLLWDEGKLDVDDGNGRPAICPRASICSEGIIQIIFLSLARLSAFASYVFMGLTFLSKMHCSINFLSKSYLRTFIPFESLHHVHTNNGKMFAGLAFIHAITHYLRYILRKDVDQLKTTVHITGLIGLLAMIVMIVGMSGIVKKYRKIQFESRLNGHWVSMIITVIALCFHHGRARVITFIFFSLWAVDYIYGVVFRTFNLEVVELLALPKQSGVQMLWRNPPNFHPRSGEYVKIKLPWLKHGGEEWHPFSIYLKENTKRGWKSVHGIDMYDNFIFNDIEDNSLEEFIRLVLLADFAQDPTEVMNGATLMGEEAREDLSKRSETTQVFIQPTGDWTKGLIKEIEEQKQLRACWVRGPYTSPYTVVQNFSHLVLTATGIGITPALGVMGQYPGFSRTKILVWLLRDENMLKFFAPLISDAHLSVIFYTGEKKIDNESLSKIKSYGNIFIQQSRPDSLPGTVEKIIVEFENHINGSFAESINALASWKRAAWSILYCGGSFRIKDELKNFAKKSKVGFECELFDW